MDNFPPLHTVADDAFVVLIYLCVLGLFLFIAGITVNAVRWWRRRNLMAEYVETERRR